MMKACRKKNSPYEMIELTKKLTELTVELTKELIKYIEQKCFVNECHIMAVGKIQELFLKQKSNLLEVNIL